MIEIEGIDLRGYEAQRQKVLGAVAERVEKISTLLRELREIKRLTGIDISMYDLNSQFENVAEELDSNWNSSSYHC